MDQAGKAIGVVGAGVMGKGVAQRFAQHGYRVALVDVDEDVLKDAPQAIRQSLRMAGMMHGKIDVKAAMGNISTSQSYEALADADYVVENVPEVRETKEAVYGELERVCKSDCLYLANTSCVPVTLIGSFTKRAGKVAGVHFMNPVPMKDFAEVIRGWHTLDETIEDIRALLASVGMGIEVVNDSAGFVSNRLSHLFMNEAAFLVYEGVARAEQIDNIFRKSFGHKMGPLETADLIGIDTVLHSLRVLYDQYEDPKFRACPLLKRMVEAGHTGRKSNKGFYSY